MENSKFQAPNNRQAPSLKLQAPNAKRYDLERRTFAFAQACRSFVKKLPRTISNLEDAKQLVRSSGSIGANYIEANESLSKKDFLLRIRICRKESKETRYWLELVDTGSLENLERERAALMQEATELLMIFSSILKNAE